MAATMYLLCLLSSVVCACLLARHYTRTGSKLLLWSSACFALLALNNLLVVVDLLIISTVDLSFVRLLVSLAAILVLLYGFIWETA